MSPGSVRRREQGETSAQEVVDDVIRPSICRIPRRGHVPGGGGSTGDCHHAQWVRAAARRDHDHSGGRARTCGRWPAPAAGARESVGAGAGLPPRGLGGIVVIVSLDAAGEPAAVRDARHDAAGERRDGARSQRAGQQHHRRHESVVEAHARRERQLRRRDVEPDRVDAGRVHAPVLRVGDPARRPHDRRGRRVHRGKRGVVKPGRDLQPGDQHLGLRRTAAGLDEHGGRRERGPRQRHLHAPAAVQYLPHEPGFHRR